MFRCNEFVCVLSAAMHVCMDRYADCNEYFVFGKCCELSHGGWDDPYTNVHYYYSTFNIEMVRK